LRFFAAPREPGDEARGDPFVQGAVDKRVHRERGERQGAPRRERASPLRLGEGAGAGVHVVPPAAIQGRAGQAGHAAGVDDLLHDAAEVEGGEQGLIGDGERATRVDGDRVAAEQLGGLLDPQLVEHGDAR